MSQEERLEENVARLVRAAYGQVARPDGQARAHLLRRLQGAVREQQVGTDFPDGAVILMSAVLLVMAVWLGRHCVPVRGCCLTDPSLVVAAGWVILNLVAVPVASAVVWRKRNPREIGFLSKTLFFGSKKEKR
ncbi:MAG: hypothetical protein JXA89_25550 [Anaerolineae bacterium]|nr:hypothetical protein [Anaerolineae bacterium]